LAPFLSIAVKHCTSSYECLPYSVPRETSLSAFPYCPAPSSIGSSHKPIRPRELKSKLSQSPRLMLFADKRRFPLFGLPGSWEHTVDGVSELFKQSRYRMAIAEFISIISHTFIEIRIY
jgi:hypothetical protein